MRGLRVIDRRRGPGRTQSGRVRAGLVVVALLAVILVACGLEVQNTALPDAAQGAVYSTTLSAGGGKAPYVWAISSGTLPTGLSLAPATGVISGTPTVLGTTTFSATVTDADNKTATQALAITVLVPGTWPQARRGEGRRSWAGAETTLTPANASGVHEEWSIPTGMGAPVAAGGLIYAIRLPARHGRPFGDGAEPHHVAALVERARPGLLGNWRRGRGRDSGLRGLRRRSCGRTASRGRTTCSGPPPTPTRARPPPTSW